MSQKLNLSRFGNFRVDHINKNKLDNRKVNLRVVTHAEDRAGSSLSRNNKSGYKGVCNHRGKFRSYIVKDKKQFSLGVFENKKDAAVAYDIKALSIFKEFSHLNFIPSNIYTAFLKKYLSSNYDALVWTISYGIFAHSVDDIIDQNRMDAEFILKTFELACMVYSYPFYMQHATTLFPLCKMASNTYMDSVAMERSEHKWDKNYADVLRQTGNEVMLAVIEIVSGLDIRRKASMELREISYKMHHTEDGKPV